MKSKKIIRIVEYTILAVAFYFSDRFYKIFLLATWAIEELQRKRGHKDRGETKYDREDMVRMAMMIPEYTKLTLPEVKKHFHTLSKEHIYKIIEYRRKIDGNKDDLIVKRYYLSLQEIFPKDYAH